MAEAMPHPANVPGGYFVEDGCCLTCEVPFYDAPDLFAWAHDAVGGPHCFVSKQPETAEEEVRMLTAIRHAEAGCIKYRGGDRAVQERLVEAGEGWVCIGLPADLQERSTQVRTLMAGRVERPRQGMLHRLWLTLRRVRGG